MIISITLRHCPFLKQIFSKCILQCLNRGKKMIDIYRFIRIIKHF